MNRIIDVLSGTKILEEVESPVNGKLTVVRDLAWGTHIKGGGLTQSGGVAEEVWRTALNKIGNWKLKIENCLILGLGGGGIARIVRGRWPDSEIVGVDVDPIIVGLGKKYLGLDKVQAQVQVQDAIDYCRRAVREKKRFDLICVDTYVGDKFPTKFESAEFLELVLKLLTTRGTAVFNRLYYDEKRPEAVKFGQRLGKIFSRVTPIYPEANVMFVCSN